MEIKLKRICLSAMFFSMGVILPFFTAQLKEAGDSLLPMHIPVMLCGLICGAKYGFTVGFILPFFRAALFSMPPIYPNAVWMAFELATYGFVIGAIYNKKRDRVGWVYISLIIAMISGRVVWGISKTILLGIGGSSFTFTAFLIGGFADAFLGILLQLILIPSIMIILNKNRGI